MKRTAITGFYGMNNYGDDLFCAVMVQEHGRLWPDSPMTIVSPPLAGLNSRFLIPSVMAGVYSSTSFVGALVRSIVSVLVGMRYGRIVLGGGSVLSAVKPVRVLQVAFARLYNHRFEALGVSIGPFGSKGAERRVSAFAGTFDRCVVRDRSSMEIARRNGIVGSYGGDLAALYAPPVSAHSISGPYKIGFIPCNYPGSSSATTMAQLDALLEAASDLCSREQREVVLISANNHRSMGDDQLTIDASRHLASKGEKFRIVRHCDVGVANTWKEIASCRWMFSARLHGAVTAYLCGVPFVLDEYHQKCAEFLIDIGHDDGLRLTPFSSATDRSAIFRKLFMDYIKPRVGVDQYRSRAVAAYFEVEGPESD